MSNPRLDKIHAFLAHHRYDVPKDILKLALDAASDLPTSRYQKGDFVAFYEGMGEMGHGVVESRKDDWYRIRRYHYGRDEESYPTSVSLNDIRGVSTEAKAMEYYHERMK